MVPNAWWLFLVGCVIGLVIQVWRSCDGPSELSIQSLSEISAWASAYPQIAEMVRADLEECSYLTADNYWRYYRQVQELQKLQAYNNLKDRVTD